jgi:uncharacterized caspase-like protein
MQKGLFVGIDKYPQYPLNGCVADALDWSAVMRGLGFSEQQLLLNADATRNAMLAALTNLITTAQAGDVLVFQYSGHGTQLPDLDGDEHQGDTPKFDESMIPIDYESGAYLIDDDVAAIFSQLPAGVNLTCFIDCCHSGTISRASMLLGGLRKRRERFMRATVDMEYKHKEYRKAIGQTRSLPQRQAEQMREIVFSACRSDEVAWENNGHGDYTMRAVDVLRNYGLGTTNAAFHQSVVTAFGKRPKQHPILDCAPAYADLPLLKPLV